MITIKNLSQNYITYLYEQNLVSYRTLKAYSIDLTQFNTFIGELDPYNISIHILESYIAHLNTIYKVSTIKRKIATLRSFFNYLERKNYIESNFFRYINTKFVASKELPKIIPISIVSDIFNLIYNLLGTANTNNRKKRELRNAAIVELLFSSGMRISEICSLTPDDIDIEKGTIRVHGKGNKERIIYIPDGDVKSILVRYIREYRSIIDNSKHFFVRINGKPVSDQIIRRMIRSYTNRIPNCPNITPHMFRHTFATCLLESGVDIRYIQKILGHSSIKVTEIYTHVSDYKQREILIKNNPRNLI